MLRAFASACLGVAMLTGVAQSAVLNVDAKANGGFGSSSGGTLGTAMVPFAVLGAAAFQISATGLISVCSCLPLVGPDGITFPDTPNGNGEILPLEERDGIDPDPSDFLGALIGAFVPAGTPGNPGFDDDISGDVAAAALFLIGGGPYVFSAPGAGTLYLGINDSFVANDSGSFTITITQVRATEMPEPGTLVMLGLSVVAFRAARRRGR
jgi:hypothetical protein